MIIRVLVAAAIAALLAACDATPAPEPTPAPVVARIALPAVLQWHRPGIERPSLAAYPKPTEVPPATAYP